MYGNYTRHGLPDDDREWKLTYEKNKKTNNNHDTLSIRQCFSCYKVYKGLNRICPYCGADNGKTKEQIKEEEKAELERITKIEKKQKRMEQGMAQDFGSLVKLARERRL